MPGTRDASCEGGVPWAPARVPMETLLCRSLWKLLPGRGRRALPTPALQFGFQGWLLGQVPREQGRGGLRLRAPAGHSGHQKALKREEGGGHDLGTEVGECRERKGRPRRRAPRDPSVGPGLGPGRTGGSSSGGLALRAAWGFSQQF